MHLAILYGSVDSPRSSVKSFIYSINVNLEVIIPWRNVEGGATWLLGGRLVVLSPLPSGPTQTKAREGNLGRLPATSNIHCEPLQLQPTAPATSTCHSRDPNTVGTWDMCLDSPFSCLTVLMTSGVLFSSFLSSFIYRSVHPSRHAQPPCSTSDWISPTASQLNQYRPGLRRHIHVLC